VTRPKPSGFAVVRPEELITSSQAAQRLIGEGRSPVAARQQIARAARKRDVWRSSALQLPHRERLLAHRSSVGTSRFLRDVEILLVKSRPGVSRCVAALQQHQTVLKPDAERLLAVRSDAEYVRERKALEEIGIVTGVDEGTALERLSLPFSGDTRSLARGHYQRLVRGAQIARIVIEHLRRHSIVSWGGNSFPDGPLRLARFSGYPFTACGWSWLAPLITWKDKKPSPIPVLLDVLGGDCNVFDVESHRARLARVKGITRRNHLLGVVAAYRFTKEAHHAARNAGLMVINLKDVFGDAALELMTQVGTLLSYAADIPGGEDGHAGDVENVTLTLERLKDHPFVQDLRSLGLETLSALIARVDGWEDVKVGISVPFQKETTREVDVSGLTHGGRRALVVECKAHHSDGPVAGEDVKKFFEETVPAFLRHHQRWQIEQCTAEIWTTGLMDSSARAALETISLDRRVTPSLVDGVGLEQKIPLALAPCRRLLRTIALAH